MFLSVIIPTYNRYDLLRNCLDNLMPDFQTIDSASYEIIVSDDSKINEEIENFKKEYPFVTFVPGPQKGPASNRNNGAKFSKGEWLVFIDDDCIPDRDLLLTYLNEINKGVYNGIEGYINADRPRERFDETSPLNLNGGCFWTCNVAVDKKMFNRLNGFDEGFPFAALEDTDFYERLKEVANITFLANAKVIHPWRRVDNWVSYKKWLGSHQYAIKKAKTPKDFRFRIKRLNLFIGIVFKQGKELIQYRFKGFNLYLEVLYFNFVVIFK
jgi:glycosyltransferase involved in cell wall biosynthesis